MGEHSCPEREGGRQVPCSGGSASSDCGAPVDLSLPVSEAVNDECRVSRSGNYDNCYVGVSPRFVVAANGISQLGHVVSVGGTDKLESLHELKLNSGGSEPILSTEGEHFLRGMEPSRSHGIQVGDAKWLKDIPQVKGDVSLDVQRTAPTFSLEVGPTKGSMLSKQGDDVVKENKKRPIRKIQKVQKKGKQAMGFFCRGQGGPIISEVAALLEKHLSQDESCDSPFSKRNRESVGEDEMQNEMPDGLVSPMGKIRLGKKGKWQGDASEVSIRNLAEAVTQPRQSP